MLSTAVHDAAGVFLQIADSASGERGRRAATGALVLRVVERAADGMPGCSLLERRAAVEVSALPRGAERSLLRRLLAVAEEGTLVADSKCLAPLLVDYVYELETTQRLPEANAALTLARSVAPASAEVALHAGRVARKLLERERALELYMQARDLDTDRGHIARLAAIGEAVVSADAERVLGIAIRRAIRAGDGEAAAVGLEERARVRRAVGRSRAAARDLCIAALRYTDPVDRARVAHELADLAVVIGDVQAAREALLAAVGCGSTPQQDHARSRLHTLSRDLGDEVGMRRWHSFKRPALVSLSLARATRRASTAAGELLRWREWLEGSITAAV